MTVGVILNETGQRKKSAGIARKILATNLLVVFLIVLTMTLLAYQQLKVQTMQGLQENLQLQVNLLSKDFDSRLEDIFRNIQRVAKDDAVTNSLVDDRERGFYLQQFLNGISNSISDFSVNLVLTDFAGQIRYKQHNLLVEPDSQHVAFLVEHAKPDMRLDIMQNDLVVTLMQPVIYPNTGLGEGMLIYQFSLSSWLDSSQVSELLQLSPSISGIAMSFKDSLFLAKHHIQAEQEKISRFETLGLPMEIEQPLKLVLYIDSSRSEAPLNRLLQRTLIIGLAIFLLAALMVNFLVRRQTRKILRLRKDSEKLASDISRDLLFYSEKKDEVDDLADAFNLLLDKLRLAYDELDRSSRDRLRASENRFRSMIQSVGDGIYVYDMHGSLIDTNPVASKQTGYNGSRLKNMQISDIAPEIDEQQLNVLWTLSQTHPEKFPLTMEATFCNRNHDSFPAEVRLSLIDSLGKSLYFIAIVRDISERKKQENELREARDKAEMGNRVKSQFLANMSHELRTPMNAILGMTDLALKGEMSDRQRNFVDKANQSARGLLRILNDILDFSKVEAEQMKIEKVDFQISDVFKHVSNIVELKAREKHIDWKWHIDEGVPQHLLGDSLRIGQVLLNLCNNAIKFTADGGVVEASACLTAREQQRMTLTFTVRDTGIGIAEEEQMHLFDAFHQVDQSTTRQYGGTGLGLAISQKLVELMEGNIWLESRPGEGSLFHFTVIVDETSSAAESERQEPLMSDSTKADFDESVLQGKKVLIAEDNEINQELVGELLREKGIRVSLAENGQVALEKLASESIDLVLMDCQMPIMNGYEAAREIRKNPHTRELPVIALTANVLEDDRQKAFSAGMNDFVAKPVEPLQLYRTLARWL